MSRAPEAAVGSNEHRSKQIEDIGWVRDRKIIDPTEERSMPHLDSDEQHLKERELHHNQDRDVQAPEEPYLYLLVHTERSYRPYSSPPSHATC